MAAAILAVASFFVSWGIDFIVLSPLADFMLDWGSVPTGPRVPIRAGFAFIWTVFGYYIGAKLGIGIHTRQKTAWLDLLPAAAYILAMPVVAYFVGEPVFQGPARWMLMPMTVVLSSVPVLSGYFATTAAEYITFLGRVASGKRRERHLQQTINRTGGELVVTSQRLAVAVNEHERRFREREQPYLTELAQELIQEFSRGNITVTIDEPEPLPPPPPRPLPAGNGRQDTSQPAPDRPPIKTSGHRNNGRGLNVQPEPAPDGDQQYAHVEYLRQQLAQRATEEDSRLDPPSDFTTQLP